MLLDGAGTMIENKEPMKKPLNPPIDPLRSAVVQSDLLNLFDNYIPLPGYLVPAGQEYFWYGLTPNPRGLHPFQFELYFGKKKQRHDYNRRCFQKAAKTGKAVLGCHQGLYDLFVPVVDKGKVIAFVVSGSFLKTLPSENWLTGQWKVLSGRQPAANDMEFLTYARVMMSTPVLSRTVIADYTRLLENMGQFTLGGASSARAGEEIQRLRAKILISGLPTRMIHYVSTKRDRLSWGPWEGEDLAPWDQEEFGLSRHPNTVLAVRPQWVGAQSPLNRIVQAARLQRFSYDWCGSQKEMVAGPLEGEGCFLLTSPDTKKNQAQAQLQIRDMTRRFSEAVHQTLHLKVVVGISRVGAAIEDLPEYFHQALTALRFAGHLKQSPYFYGDFPQAPQEGFYGLSREMAQAIGEGKEGQVSVIRGQLVQEALRLSGGSPDSLRIYFLHLFYLVWDEMARRAILNESEFQTYRKSLEEKLAQAFSVEELLQRFQELVEQAIRMFESPAEGTRLERLEAARRYMALNCRRKLTVGEVARETGFSVSRFSHLFHEVFGESFIDYFTRLRCEEAGRLLKTSSLSVAQVAQTCGFGTSSHFTHIFKQRVGCTPVEYRLAGQPKDDIKKA